MGIDINMDFKAQHLIGINTIIQVIAEVTIQYFMQYIFFSHINAKPHDGEMKF